MAVEQYLFKFLENLNYVAAETARDIEERIFDDPKSAVMNARVFAEEIVKDVFRKEEIDYSHLTTHFERINYLAREGFLEKGTQQALAEIRLTGNKALHDATFRPDILEAIKIFKEMYKLGTWFAEVYSSDISIPSYKDPIPPQKGLGMDDVQNMIEQALSGKLSQYLNLKNEDNNTVKEQEGQTDNESKVSGNDDQQENKVITLNLNLPEGRSYLLRELKRLQESSQEAVENSNSFSKFKDYMHVAREIQKDFEEMITITKDSDRAELILLTGSVGDGKSHLLAYYNEKQREVMNKFEILNDATESFSPNKNALETLSELLDGFSDQKIELSKDKVILAINLGILHNFLSYEHEGKSFNKLKGFIEESGLFTQKVTTKYSEESFHLIGFSDYQSYELTNGGPKSSFYLKIFQKVFSNDSNNPFYISYQEDLKNNVKGVIHENFEFLMDKNIQNEIIQLIIQGIVRNKLVISARAFYNFIADLVIPEGYSEILDFEWNHFEKINNTVPHLLFKRRERSVILKTMSELDPIHIRSQAIDQIFIDINTLNDWDKIIEKYSNNYIAKEWLGPIAYQSENFNGLTSEFSQLLVRLAYLTNNSFAEEVIPSSYKNYMKYLYSFNKVEQRQIATFYKEIIQTIFKWRGSPKTGYIYINKPIEKFRIAQELSLKPKMDHLSPNNNDILTSFKQTLTIVFSDKQERENLTLEVDYPLYELLSNVQRGYCPNKKDEEDAIKFVEFLDQIMKFGNKSNEVLVHIPTENKQYVLSKGLFDGYTFEKVL
ncbi:DNA phosphorothioation-dependent restriction protein DptF [Bacillus salitolerans]|uniref:DNA phosphorothioation-dependent restriction protein DptF n=1 Tax=Bacillus salitolerans TaxID=1437434 RepID=A0ABW4LWL7_9BACI